jgi:DNA-binding MarR family transcriptional regulator
MRFEDEIQTNKFQNETQKAHLNIMFTSGWVEARITNALKKFDITEVQYNVLRIVRGQKGKPIRPKDIYQRQLNRYSNTTRIIERLVSKGFLLYNASEHNRRERDVLLTQAGSQLLTQIEADWTHNNPHTSILTTDEAHTLNTLLDKLREV